MATDRFDQSARFVARFDPEGFLAWLVPGFGKHLRFRRWLDTRTAPAPGQPNQTADTVAELVSLHRVESPWLLLLEMQTEPDPEMFGRLLGQLGKFWREHQPDDLPGSSYQLLAAVVNLTGTKESLPASRSFAFPLEGLGLGLAVKERYLAEESAKATLDTIAAGATARSLLALIPLMTGGGEKDIIKRWLEVAATEPDHRRRGDLGILALTMAELKPWYGKWQKALKEWNMRESTVVQEWIDKGKAENLRENLRRTLTTRFGAVSVELLRRIDASTDFGQLDRAFDQALTVTRLEDLRF